MAAIFGEGKFFLKIANITFLRYPVGRNFDEIALSRTVKEIEANLCFAIFQNIFPSPKMAAILNFRIFAKNGKTQICFYLLNRAR